MPYIVTSEAALRIIAANAGDPIKQWLEAEKIRPFIATPTLALLRYRIAAGDGLNAAQRVTYARRYEILLGQLKRNNGKGSVVSAEFDHKSADILHELMLHDVALSDLEMLPAAIAIQRNLELIVASETDIWRDLEARLRGADETLSLKVFEPLPPAA